MTHGGHGDTLAPSYMLDAPIKVSKDEREAARRFIQRRCPIEAQQEVLEALDLEVA